MHAKDAATRLAQKAPLVRSQIRIGERDWWVTRVDDQDALLDIAERFAHIPYGLLLWSSAVGLAQHVAASPELVRGKRVLELGAGVGLPGIVARALGAEVCQTDHEADALALARINAADNAVSGITYQTLDWTRWAATDRWDVLLGADILYERDMHFHLRHIFEAALAPVGLLLLSDPGRPQAMELLGALEHAGWQMEITTRHVRLPSDPPDAKPAEVAIVDCAPPAPSRPTMALP